MLYRPGYSGTNRQTHAIHTDELHVLLRSICVNIAGEVICYL